MQTFMKNKLQQIIEKKKKDIEKKKQLKPLDLLKREAMDTQLVTTFTAQIMHPKNRRIGIIAEIKLASPTEPSLGSIDTIIQRAISYEQANVDALSIITEEHFFKGNISFIPTIKNEVSLPVFQKDFVIDSYQIYEAKTLASDALLLIARILDESTLHHFVLLCHELGIEPVVEVQNEEDLQKAYSASPSVIAVNARDLETFEVSVDKACEMLQKVPDSYIKLGFSGIKSRQEIQQYSKAGVNGVLIGTSFMKADNSNNFMEHILEV